MFYSLEEIKQVIMLINKTKMKTNLNTWQDSDITVMHEKKKKKKKYNAQINLICKHIVYIHIYWHVGANNVSFQIFRTSIVRS